MRVLSKKESLLGKSDLLRIGKVVVGKTKE